MIIDNRTTFCRNTSVVQAAAGTFNIGDVLDIGEAHGLGFSILPVLQLNAKKAIVSAGKFSFALVSSDNPTIPTDDTQKVIYKTGDYTGIDAPEVISSMRMPNIPHAGRYIGLQITCASPVTAGEVDAMLLFDAPGNYAYPKG